MPQAKGVRTKLDVTKRPVNAGRFAVRKSRRAATCCYTGYARLSGILDEVFATVSSGELYQ
ncbi:hypothetical protein KCP71_16900 [Salmonella enterica subsp. enterica]|nr:hypothetical protein KCP71_16900 [Salmonella enterica subsp. enterica]